MLIFAQFIILPGTVSASPSTVVSKIPTDKMMALTFDAGSNVGNTQDILKILAQNNVKSTFFLTGNYTKQYPYLAQEIVQQGHEIGNHSYSHPNFTVISVAAMKDEIKKTHQEILMATGKAPVPLFRPPFGSYNATVLKAVGEAGYKWTVMWSIDTIDWKGLSAVTILRKATDNAQPGAIVLMHVGSGTHTVEALPAMIKSLQAQGYSLTTVTTMLNQDSTGAGKTYTVRPGDTLWKIATTYGTTIAALVAANKISDPNLISPGQVLLIPEQSPVNKTYTVMPGDTLWKISTAFKTTVTNLVQLNKIANPSLIYPGQLLLIP